MLVTTYIAGLTALGGWAWWITRDLRKATYPRFAIQIAIAALIVVVVAVGYVGAAYEREHPNMGEPEY